MIKRIRRGTAPDRYEPENWFIRLTDHDDHIHPVSNKPPRKDSFIPSKWEAKRVSRFRFDPKKKMALYLQYHNLTCIMNQIRYLSWAIKKGIIKLDKEKKEDKKEQQYFLIWDDNINDQKRRELLPAPKQRLPGNAQSLN